IKSMKTSRFYFLIVLCLLLGSCQQPVEKQEKTQEEQQTPQKFAIAIHGGAGDMNKKFISDSLETAYKEKLEEAVEAGYAVLAKGESAVEAIQVSIRILEDSPLFNAGKGAVLNHLEKP